MGRNKNKEISTELYKKLAPLLPVVTPSSAGLLVGVEPGHVHPEGAAPARRSEAHGRVLAGLGVRHLVAPHLPALGHHRGEAAERRAGHVSSTMTGA